MKSQQLFLCGAAIVAMTASARAELDIGVGFHSDYEFRGFNLGTDLAVFNLDYSRELNRGFSVDFGLWYGSSDSQGSVFVQRTEDDILADGVEEFNASIGLSKDFGRVKLSGGYTYRHYNENRVDLDTLNSLNDYDTGELYIRAKAQLSHGFEIGGEYIYDFEAYDGGYLEAYLSKYVALTPNVGLKLTAGVAWSFDYNIDGEALVNGENDIELDDFSHYYVSLDLPIQLGDGFKLTPYIKYVGSGGDLFTNLDLEFDNLTPSQLDDTLDDYFVGGVTFSVSF